MVQVDPGRLRTVLSAWFAAALPLSPHGLQIDLASLTPDWVRLSFPEPLPAGGESLQLPLRALVEAHGGRFGTFADGGIWLDLPRAGAQLDA
ncbi:hypothetical protein D3C72_2243140 [compost metagenome]